MTVCVACRVPHTRHRRRRGFHTTTDSPSVYVCGVSVTIIMPKSKRRAAAPTLDALDGKAHLAVPFLRTDARAAVEAASTSKTKLKEAFSSELDPQWSAIAGDDGTAILRQLNLECGSGSGDNGDGDARRIGALSVRLGRAAVARALKRCALAAVVIAKDGGAPLLYAHLAALAQESGTPVCVLACSSAQLGQPFGLLRASTVGLLKEHFDGGSSLLLDLVRKGATRKKPTTAGPRAEPGKTLLLWDGSRPSR